MAQAVEPKTTSPRASRWSFQRPYLLWLLVVVALAGVALYLAGRQERIRSLSAMSLSDLRIEAQTRPQDPEVRLRLAERYIWEERNEAALREAKKAVALAPHDAQARYVLAKAYQRFRQPDAAIRELEQALKLDPEHGPARFLLGHAHYWHGRPLMAARYFQEYVERQPADDLGFRFLGISWLRLGEFAKAEPALRRAVELEPESSANHQALGDFYLTRAQGREDLERAVEESLRAVGLDPNSRGIREQAAMALQRVGRFQEAASHYEAIFEKAPTDEKTCYALLQLYTRLKDAPRAARYDSLYRRIVRAREASSAITANAPGTPSAQPAR